MKNREIIARIFSIATYFATYIPLALSGAGINMWGLAWQWWAIIFFTIFSVSIGLIYWELQSKIKKLESPDAILERRKKELEIEELYDKSPGRRPPR